MRFTKKRNTPWRRKFIWFPITLDDTTIWLEHLEMRLDCGQRQYRIPGDEGQTIYTVFWA